MTVQEFYDWCERKGLTNARLEVCIDGSYFVDVTEQDIFDCDKEIVVFTVET